MLLSSLFAGKAVIFVGEACENGWRKKQVAVLYHGAVVFPSFP